MRRQLKSNELYQQNETLLSGNKKFSSTVVVGWNLSFFVAIFPLLKALRLNNNNNSNNNNNNNNESLFDQKIKTHILCYNIN